MEFESSSSGAMAQLPGLRRETADRWKVYFGGRADSIWYPENCCVAEDINHLLFFKQYEQELLRKISDCSPTHCFIFCITFISTHRTLFLNDPSLFS